MYRLLVLFVCLFCLSICSPTEAQGASGVMFGGEVTIGSDEISRGDLVLLGGRANIEGEVQGDVILLGGRADIDGSIRGDLVVLGGRVVLMELAVIHGDVVNLGSSITRRSGSEVLGEFRSVTVDAPWYFEGFFFPILGINWIVLLVTFFYKLLVILIISYFFPYNARGVANTIQREWGITLLLGFVAVLAFLPGLIFLAITIIGIPLILLLVFMFWMAALLGQVGLFFFFGQRFSRRETEDGEERPRIMGQAVLGLLVFYFFRIILQVVPVAGGIFSAIFVALVYLTALGASLRSRFGTMRPWLPR